MLHRRPIDYALAAGASLLFAGCWSLLGGDLKTNANAPVPDASLPDASLPDVSETDAGEDGGPACDDGGLPFGSSKCVGSSSVVTCGISGESPAQPCPTSTICVSGACVPPRSCATGGAAATCGADGGESCCDSVPVPGGSFIRDYDGVNEYYQYAGDRATISSFRLDTYEVTVGRYRQFVSTVMSATPPWTPAAGAGKHDYLNAGKGLVVALQSSLQYEGGWNPSWDNKTDYSFLNGGDWPASVTAGYCPFAEQTWTTVPGANESLPINCVSWYEAYAFCIWDGGFLPTDAELNYAAAGGAEQRQYAWSSPPKSGAIGVSNANFCPALPDGGTGFPDGGACTVAPTKVGSLPAGDGRWGHADLAGNVDEWVLDYSDGHWTPGPLYQLLPAQCTDCAVLPTTDDAGPYRVERGGSFWDPASDQLSSFVQTNNAAARFNNYGVRCARAP